MYKLNGFDLNDPARGWTVLDSSEWTAGTTIARPSLSIPGADGGLPLPGYQETPSLGLVIGTRYSRLGSLKALLGQPELHLERAGTPGTARVEVNAISEERMTGGDDPEMEVKAVLSIPGVWYRGELEDIDAGLPVVKATNEPPAQPPAAPPVLDKDGNIIVDVGAQPEIGDAAPDEPLVYEFKKTSHDFDAFQGLTGKIPDVMARISGVKDPKLTDSAGSFIAYKGEVAEGKYLVIDASTGRAWLNSSRKAWNREQEVDPLLLSYGRGPAFLVITPHLGEDLDNPSGRLNLTYTPTTPTPSAELHGRNAYVV